MFMTGTSDANSKLHALTYQLALIISALCFVSVSILPWVSEVGMANPRTADTLGLWVHFLGKFHPLFLHLPIGALAAAIVMELAAAFSRNERSNQTTIVLFTAVITGTLAAIFGYFLYLTGAYEGEVMEEHKRDGILFTLLLIVTFVVKVTNNKLGKPKGLTAFYVLCMALSSFTVICAGHHGGSLSHGDPFDALPHKILNTRGMSSSVLPEVDPIVYEHYVRPILEDKCNSCHGEKKQKGALRLDTIDFMLEGGEETACLVPGNVKESSLITYLHLPLDDDLRMPPENKPQLTDAEMVILEWWVREGASGQATVSELAKSPEVTEALESYEVSQ